MIVAGCDIGSRTSKAVIMQDSSVLSSAVILSKARPEESAEEVMGHALKRVGISLEDIALTIGTGYGKEQIPFSVPVIFISHVKQVQGQGHEKRQADIVNHASGKVDKFYRGCQDHRYRRSGCKSD